MGATRLLADLASAPLRVAGAAAAGWGGYWADYWSDVADATGSGAPVRWPGADLASWWTACTLRERPRWAHPSREVWRRPLARLLDYSRDPGSGVVPTLVLPPQAGHDSCIVDFSAEQSQLATLRAAGLDPLFTLDWAAATPGTAGCSIEDYLGLLSDTVAELGGRVNLVGDCQGGWLATIWAALHPERVHTLTVAGAPVDTHAGRSPLRDWTRLLTEAGRLYGGGPLAPYRAMVAAGGGVQRGALQALGFALLEPGGWPERNLALLARAGDPEAIRRYSRFADWFAWPVDIPGAFYLWAVEHLFLGNELARGTLEVGGRRVDLGRIGCPVFLLAGSADHITPPDQVWALAERVGTPAPVVYRERVPGGHLGLFMGRRALREHWAPAMRAVHAWSRPGD